MIRMYLFLIFQLFIILIYKDIELVSRKVIAGAVLNLQHQDTVPNNTIIRMLEKNGLLAKEYC